MSTSDWAAKSMATAVIFAASTCAKADRLGPVSVWTPTIDFTFHPHEPTPLASFVASKFRAAPASQRNSWRTVMVVSAAVGVAGLVSGDDVLVFVGAAGVAVSLVETGGTSFRYQSFHHGYELMKTGPLSMGVGSFGYGRSPFASASRPGPYVELSFKL